MTHPSQDRADALGVIVAYLDNLIARTGLNLKFTVLVQDGCADCDRRRERDPAALSSQAAVATPGPSADPDPAAAAPNPAGLLDAAPAPAPAPWIKVDFSGPDTPLLLASNAELLHSLEHVAAKILRLEPEDHDRISFDAEGFKAARHAELERSAEHAVHTVRSTNRPHAFPPMNSRERRILHLILSRSGLPTASSSLGPRRFVVLYPQGSTLPTEPDPSRPEPSAAERTAAIRSRFRRR